MDNSIQANYIGSVAEPARQAHVPAQLSFLIIADEGGQTPTPDLEASVSLVKASSYYRGNCIVSHTSAEHAAFCRKHGVRSAKRSAFLDEKHSVVKLVIEKYLQGMMTLVVVVPGGQLDPGRIDAVLEVFFGLGPGGQIELPVEGLYVVDINTAIKQYYGEPKEK